MVNNGKFNRLQLMVLLKIVFFLMLSIPMFSQQKTRLRTLDSSMTTQVHQQEFRNNFDTIGINTANGNLYFKMRGGEFPFKRLIYLDEETGRKSTHLELYEAKESIRFIEKKSSIEINRLFKFVWSFRMLSRHHVINYKKTIEGKMTLGVNNELILFDVTKEEGKFYDE